MVICLGNYFLFKSILACCGLQHAKFEFQGCSCMGEIGLALSDNSSLRGEANGILFALSVHYPVLTIERDRAYLFCVTCYLVYTIFKYVRPFVKQEACCTAAHE